MAVMLGSWSSGHRFPCTRSARHLRFGFYIYLYILSTFLYSLVLVHTCVGVLFSTIQSLFSPPDFTRRHLHCRHFKYRALWWSRIELCVWIIAVNYGIISQHTLGEPQACTSLLHLPAPNLRPCGALTALIH